MADQPIPSSGFIRWPDPDSAQAAFSLTSGLVAASSLVGALQPIPLQAGQGFKLMFGGAGADNDTASYKIWAVTPTYGVDNNFINRNITGYHIGVFGYGAIALSTAKTMGNVAGAAALRIADTVTFTLATSATTPIGIGGIIEAAYGSPGTQIISPADNINPGLVIVPHMGWVNAMVLEFDLTGTSTAAFGMVARA